MKSKSKTSFDFIRIKLESVLIVHQFAALYINNLSRRVLKFRVSCHAIYRSFSLFLFLIFVFTISLCKRVEKEWSRSQ
jgi:hypothetical protein